MGDAFLFLPYAHQLNGNGSPSCRTCIACACGRMKGKSDGGPRTYSRREDDCTCCGRNPRARGTGNKSEARGSHLRVRCRESHRSAGARKTRGSSASASGGCRSDIACGTPSYAGTDSGSKTDTRACAASRTGKTGRFVAERGFKDTAASSGAGNAAPPAA